MHPGRVLDYAISCLEREADELAVHLKLFQIPMESFEKKHPVFDSLRQRITQLMTGQPKLPLFTPEDQILVDEVEREMEEAYPWLKDKDRTRQIQREYGFFGIGLGLN